MSMRLPAEPGMAFATFEGDLDEKVHVLSPSARWKAEEGMLTSAKCGYSGYTDELLRRPVATESICSGCQEGARPV